MAAVPFPPSRGYICAVRESASVLRIANGVTISRAAIHRLLRSPAFTSTFPRLSQSHGLAFPLKFSSVLSELNVLAVLSLVNMGSGYRVPLHVHTGRGAWDNIRAFILALFISSSVEGGDGDLLSARAMKAATVQKVAEAMRVPIYEERPHESLPGVVVGERGGPLLELIQLVTGMFNETGDVLLSQGYPDLGSFVLEALREGEKTGKAQGGGVDANVVLEKLVRAIPAFRDMSIVGGKPVYIFKKALFLLHAISFRFSPSTMPVPDVSELPVFSDNVLPSMLIHLGVLDVSQSSLATAFPTRENIDTLLQLPPDAIAATEPKMDWPPKEGPVLSRDDAYIIRAAAIDACEQIVSEAHEMANEPGQEWLLEVTRAGVDAWLWAGAKDRRDYRELERFVLRDTVFF